MATRDDLLKRAEELGLPTNSGVYKPRAEAWTELETTEYELHKRIREEERHRREHRLWIVAVVAAMFAFLSALAAWWAVVF